MHNLHTPENEELQTTIASTLPHHLDMAKEHATMNALQEHSIVASFFKSGEQTFTDNPTLHEIRRDVDHPASRNPGLR